MIATINIPTLPPSTNTIYKRTMKGRLYLNKTHVDFKQQMKDLLLKDKIEVTDKKLKIEIIFSGCRKNADIDNMLKSLFDSMNKIVYHDDKQIFQIVATKECGGEKSTNITITEFTKQ